MTLIFILYFVTFLLIWQFVGYPTAMAILVLKSKLENIDYSFQPFISIIIPSYNEEKTIKHRIENIFNSNYPKNKYEIIVVDSDSKDSTVGIVKEILKYNNQLKLIEEGERKGKSSAIEVGKRNARGDIILVTDANSIFDRNVLKEIGPLFKDPRIGGVGGQYIVQNSGKSITDSAQFYWDIEYIMRKGERIIDSACLFHGEINAWRKNLVESSNTLSEDLDSAIQIRKKGFKVEYAPSAVVYESTPDNIADQIKQRKRTSIGTIQCIFKHWNYFIFPKNWYNAVIFPSHKSLTMISPFLLISIPILYIAEWNLNSIIMHLISSILIFSLLLGLLMRLKSKIRLSVNSEEHKKISLFSISKIIFYVLLNEYIILLAWKDFILGNYSIFWEKVESTR